MTKPPAQDTVGNATTPPTAPPKAESFANAVRRGLTAIPKSLPPKFFYDEVGSQLFEAICFLPEYYLTRAERGILETHARDMVRRLEPDARLVELGAGSAVKTRIVIRAMLDDRPGLIYCPIDISEEAMRIAEANIRSEFGAVRFKGIVGDWMEALGRLGAMDAMQKLVLFLGSSIGNLDAAEAAAFLKELANRLRPDDKLLLGTDMVHDVETHLAAYDDAAGVTAAFNKNLLVRINTELGGRFDTRLFRHEARWDPINRRIEMHLVATKAHTVHIDGLGLDVRFEEGESIHTENSHKYRLADVHALAEGAGLVVEGTWHDPGKRFAVHLIGRAE